MQNNEELSKPWYSISGFEDDVIISSRIRIARNLSDFVFTSKLQSEEKERIRALVLDAINFENEKNINFDFVEVNELSDQGKMILMERNILAAQNCDSLFMAQNGNYFCRVCESEHVKLAAFQSGLNFQNLFETVYYIDEKMQEKVQYAANYNFGYTNSSLENTGTGLKTSFWCYIPSIEIGRASCRERV